MVHKISIKKELVEYIYVYYLDKFLSTLNKYLNSAELLFLFSFRLLFITITIVSCWLPLLFIHKIYP